MKLAAPVFEGMADSACRWSAPQLMRDALDSTTEIAYAQLPGPMASTRITRQTLDEMFAQIRATSKWAIDGPMLWGYFFTDHDQQKLEAAIPVLEARGYRFVTLLGPDPEAEDPGLIFLHVERVEAHSSESLDVRNQELYSLAAALDLRSYDGMDVGPVHH